MPHSPGDLVRIRQEQKRAQDKATFEEMTSYIDAKLLEAVPEPLRPIGPYILTIDEKLLTCFKSMLRDNDLIAAYKKAGWDVVLVSRDGGSGWDAIRLLNANQ